MFVDTWESVHNLLDEVRLGLFCSIRKSKSHKMGCSGFGSNAERSRTKFMG